MAGREAAAEIPAPSIFGWFFVIIGLATTFAVELLGGSQLYVGRCLQRRHSYVLCQIVAGISCLMIPFGTLLGFFSFMVFQRPSVAILFGQRPSVCKDGYPPTRPSLEVDAT
jgi:hypothetical protein